MKVCSQAGAWEQDENTIHYKRVLHFILFKRDLKQHGTEVLIVTSEKTSNMIFLQHRYQCQTFCPDRLFRINAGSESCGVSRNIVAKNV